MVYWHIETDLVALLMFGVLLTKAVFLNKEKNFTDKTFGIALILGTASTIVDIFSSTMMNELVNWWLYEISMIIYGLFSPVPTIVWVCYTIALMFSDNETKARRYILNFLIIFAAYSAIIVTNPLHELYFHLGPNMEYSRGDLFLILIVGSQVFYAIIGTILVIINWKKFESVSISILLIFLYAFTTASYFIQIANPGWLIICSAYALAFLICDATFESQRRNKLYTTITQSYEKLREDQQKELEYQEKLKEAAIEANRANRAKSGFLSHMSHDIRTPINGIRGMLEIIRKERHNEERVDDCIQKIETASGYLLSLINDVLDMSKLESGDITLIKTPFNLQKLLAECYDISVSYAVDHGIKLNYEQGTNILHPHLIGSPLHVRQVVLNIVTNAIKYTEPGGEVTCVVEELSDNDDSVVYQFSVTDTGIGISQDFFPNLFRPFSQEHSGSHTNYEGTGLGLAIVKKILDQMNGYITVKSEVGVGSTFTFTIPFAIDHSPQPDVPEAVADTEPIMLSGAKILLVEDNPLNQEIAQFILENSGADVDLAINGQEALDMFRESKPGTYQAILMDVMMPVMDGLEATHEIRDLNHPDANIIPIIAMTANAFSEDAIRCLDAGMNVHLTKPLDSHELLKTLKSYIPKV